MRGFKWVGVFDVSQTDGEELPTVGNRLTGEDREGVFARLVGVAHSIGFTVENARLPGTTNGDCSHLIRTIRVETDNPPTQRVKTLAHEIARHAACDVPRCGLAELQTESVAWVVCQSLGIDASDYSFGYVATWAGGGERAIAGITSSCDRIQTGRG